MAPRHRRPARLTPRARRTLLGLAMVAVLAPVAGVALGSAIGDVKDCGDEVKVDVAAAPEIAPVLAEYAKSWTADAAPVKGVCVSVEVTPMDSASVASAFAKKHKVDLDLGGTPANRVEMPDVWVPESMTWLARLGGDLNGVLATDEVSSVAESAVGLAIPKAQADKPPVSTWGDATVSARDPRVDAASLALAMGSVKDTKSKPGFGSDGLEVVSNAQLKIHNDENSDDKWTFVEPSPALRPFDYPYVTLSKQDDALRKATEGFKSALVSDKFTGALAEHGMSKAGPYPQAVDPKDVEKALKQDWG